MGGDIIDVLVNETLDEDRWSRVLSHYKALVVTAEISSTTRSALLKFVAGGGTVVLTAGCVRADDTQLTGVRFSGFISAVRGWHSAVLESVHLEPLLVADGSAQAS